MIRKCVSAAMAMAFVFSVAAQPYPLNAFRHPLNIPMQLVANFGEIRTNHWHMGLDIRTQQRENLPVLAAAEGYVARVLVEPGGFGQALYIAHPNGLTTLYAHMNAFYPQLAAYVKEQQYALQSWRVDLELPAGRFPLAKGDYIGLSGNTGGSAGPHVHFEVRDSKTGACLNPLLFQFPLPDAVPPTVTRIALYDRNRSTYRQTPQLMPLKRTGAYFSPAASSAIRVGSNAISFALSAVDRLSGSSNPNGIYSATVYVDEKPVSEFVHNNIGYEDTRYINGQIDLPYQARTGISLQHLSPPAGVPVPYNTFGGDGLIHLHDSEPHQVLIEVADPRRNVTRIRFSVQYDAALAKPVYGGDEELFAPNAVNVFESDAFELFTTEQTMYDTVAVSYTIGNSTSPNAVSPQHHFLSAALPAHDSVTVRIRPDADLSAAERNRVLIRNTAGKKTFVQKAQWQNGWLAARFRQFGTYQAFVDDVPPTVNAPLTDLSKASRIVFTPQDNFNVIKSFRVELDGRWLCFSNDKGKSWIYRFDEQFPRGEHQLKVRVEDEAGNVTEREWTVRR